MKFQYTRLPPLTALGTWRGMPFVEVTISGPKDERTVLALVDSGAEYCMVNAAYAENLGIDLASRPIVNVYGVVGMTEQKRIPLAPITIHVSGLPKPVEITAGFIESDAVGVILGQEGFFDLHRIKFEKDHNTFEITPVRR